MKKRLFILGAALLGTTGAVCAAINPSTTQVKATVEDFNAFYTAFVADHAQDHFININDDVVYQLTDDLTLSHIVNVTTQSFELDLNGHTLSLAFCYKATMPLYSIDDYGGFCLDGTGSIKVYDSGLTAGKIVGTTTEISSIKGPIWGRRNGVGQKVAGSIFTTTERTSSTLTKYGTIDVENIEFYMDYQIDGSAGSPTTNPYFSDCYYDEARLLYAKAPVDVTFKKITYSAKYSPMVYARDAAYDRESSSNPKATYLFENCSFDTGFLTGLSFRGNSDIKFKNTELTCSYTSGYMSSCNGDRGYYDSTNDGFLCPGSQPVYETIVSIDQNASVEFESCNVHDSKRLLLFPSFTKWNAELINTSIKFSGATSFTNVENPLYLSGFNSPLSQGFKKIIREFADETSISNFNIEADDEEISGYVLSGKSYTFFTGNQTDLAKLSFNSDNIGIGSEVKNDEFIISAKSCKKQPTTASPSVEAYLNDNATYQWYNADIVSEIVTTETDSVNIAYSDATYIPSGKKWRISDTRDDDDFFILSMQARKGDVFTIHFFDNGYFKFYEDGYAFDLEVFDINLYSIMWDEYEFDCYKHLNDLDIVYKVATDCMIDIYIEAEFYYEDPGMMGEREEISTPLEFTITKSGYGPKYPIIGETSNELSTPTKGKYFCKVTWDAGTVNEYSIFSAMLDYDLVQLFIDTYMHMNDYKSQLGYCADSEHHYYATAKAAYNALDDELKEQLNTDELYQDAFNRLKAWAAANGDQINSSYEIVSLGRIYFADVNSNSGIIIVTVISSLIACLGITAFFLKKKKLVK